MIDLSIVVPTVRPGYWKQIYDTIENSAHPYSYEMIFVGPYVDEIPALPDIKTIKEFGCPSRCVQIGVLAAIGRYMTWGSDDALYEPLALGECVALLDEKKIVTEETNGGDIVLLQYIEGFNNNPSLFADGENNPHYRGPHPELKLGYYHAHFHDDLRLDGIDLNARVVGQGVLATSRFKQLGGFDCRMQHINMSCFDFSLRLEKDAGKVFVSPSLVMKADFEPNNIVHQVMHKVDGPLFKSIYSTVEGAKARPAVIDYNNWMQADPVWDLRWHVVKK